VFENDSRVHGILDVKSSKISFATGTLFSQTSPRCRWGTCELRRCPFHNLRNNKPLKFKTFAILVARM